MSKPAATIELTVNGAPREVGDRALLALLRELGVDPERGTGIAVARNDTVVPRGAWAATLLEPGDRLEVIGAVQGG